MNLPNKLTVFRVILIPVFVVFMLVPDIPGAKWYALFFFCLASVTDFFDGYLARKNNLVTDFGKFMDPLADKLLICSALIALCSNGRFPAWIVIIIIAREFTISGFRLIASDNGRVISASMWGKVKTVIQMFAVIMLIMDLNNVSGTGSTGDGVIYVIEQCFIYLALVLTVVSLIDYIVKNRDVISTTK